MYKDANIVFQNMAKEMVKSFSNKYSGKNFDTMANVSKLAGNSMSVVIDNTCYHASAITTHSIDEQT